MKNKKLSEYTQTDLNIEVKTRKNYVLVMFLFVIIMFGCAVFITMAQGFTVFAVTPIVFIAVLMNLYKNYKDAKKEQESRQS